MKASITTGLVLVAIIAGIYFLYTSDMVSGYLKKSTEEISKKVPVSESGDRAKEFGEFTDYFRADLYEEEKIELKKVLASREDKLKRARSIIEKEYANPEGKMEEAFAIVDTIRQEVKETLVKYLDKDKMVEFEEKYRQLGRDLESEYLAK